MAAACDQLSAGVDMGDRGLVQRAQAGERSAFDALIVRYQDRVLKLTMRYTRNRCDAEDAAQETFIKAYKGLRHFRGECAFYTWLHRIAINSAKNVLIARAHGPVMTSLDLEGSENDRYSQHALELETPERIALTDDIRGAVAATLAALPETHRIAIMLREIDELTYKQIAVALDTPIGTVRSRIFRAREIIDQQLCRVYEEGLGRRDRIQRKERKLGRHR